MSSQILWWTEPRKLSMELPRHLPMAPFSPGLTGSLPSPQVWVPPWLAQLSQPSQAPEKDRLHDVSRDLGLFNKPCRQSTQLAYGSRLLLPHETSKLRNKSTGSWKNLELRIQLFTVDDSCSTTVFLIHPKFNLQKNFHPHRASAFGSSLAGSSFSAVSGACKTGEGLPSHHQRKQGRKRKKP